VKDFSLFFEALPRLAPGGALVGLAGGFTSRELIPLLPQARGIDAVQSLPDPLPDEFLDATFLPVTETTAGDLRELDDREIWPGFLLFIVVISHGQSILEWYDAPGDPIAIAISVSEEAVQEFATATNGSYQRVEQF
jgi:hypothetical protein